MSGIGHVLDGVQFSNGKVVVSWLGKGKIKAASVSIWDRFEDFESIHITSHPQNKTKIIWEDAPDFPKE